MVLEQPIMPSGICMSEKLVTTFGYVLAHFSLVKSHMFILE